MKSLLHKPLSFFSKPFGLIFASLMALSLFVAGCQTTDTDSPGKGEAAKVANLIVYGKIDSLGTKKVDNKSVLIIPHRNPCTDSTNSSGTIPRHLVWGYISQSGSYRIPFPWPLRKIGKKYPCFRAFVVSYDISKEPSPLEYDSLLAGPKKLGADFASHFRVKPPFDSVRVDFTVHDSTKRAVDDSTMQ